MQVIPTHRTGLVTDVNLRRLRSLRGGARIRQGGHPHVELRAYVGAQVVRGRSILVLSTSATSKMVEKAGRVVRVEEREEIRAGGLAEVLERLHEEALAAIRGGSPTRYEEVIDAYEAALFAFPNTWQRHGQRLDSQAAQGMHPMGLSQTDEFLRNLGMELDEAARSDACDVASAAAYAPARVAYRAFEPDASAISGKVLNLLNVVY